MFLYPNVSKLLKELFASPVYVAGDKVNHLPQGRITRTDGFVVAQDDRGVLVEWPREGCFRVAASELCRIG